MERSQIDLTSESVLKTYGCLLSMAQLAELLHRHPKGLRWQLSTSSEPWVKRVRAARVKIGRRVLFESAEILKIIADAKSGKITDPDSDCTAVDSNMGGLQ